MTTWRRPAPHASLELAQVVAPHRVGRVRGVADQGIVNDPSLAIGGGSSPRRLLRGLEAMPGASAKAMIAAAASSISPRPPTQRKTARTSRAATAAHRPAGRLGAVVRRRRREVEHVVGAFDDGVDLARRSADRARDRLRPARPCGPCRRPAPARALLLDLGQRHRRGVGHRLADQAAIDLLVGRQRRLVAQQDLQEAEMRHVPCRAPAGRW